MFNKKSTKTIALALCGAFSFGVFSTTAAVSAEASALDRPHIEKSFDSLQLEQLSSKKHRNIRNENGHEIKYTTGERNTAIIGGIVAGYIAAKLIK